EAVAPTGGQGPGPSVAEKGPEPPAGQDGGRPGPPSPPPPGTDGPSVAEIEGQAARAIEKLGGKGERLEASLHRPGISAGLHPTKVADAGLRAVAVFTRLRRLDLGATEVSDAGLKHLTGLTGLQELVLTSTRVTDAGMRDVAELKQLESLDLHYTP